MPELTRSTSAEPVAAGPAYMRGLVRKYVAVLHATYIQHVGDLAPGERAALPLLTAGEFTVAAAASRQLHLIAVAGRLPAAVAGEPDDVDGYGGLSWHLRFFDPSVLPELGLLSDDSPAEVRRVLGLSDTVYHLTVSPGSGLDDHHAQHSGVALSNAHSRTGRDLDRLRRSVPRHRELVDELAVCVRSGLHRAAALLADEISSGRVRTPSGAGAEEALAALVADAAHR